MLSIEGKLFWLFKNHGFMVVQRVKDRDSMKEIKALKLGSNKACKH